MGKIKGIILNDIEKTLVNLYGPDKFEKVKAALPADVRQALEKPYSKISWIEYKPVIQLGLTADRVLGKSDFQLMEVIAATSARNQLKGVYKYFICLTSPKAFMKRIPFLWQRYFNEGHVELTHLDDHQANITLTQFTNMPLHHEHDMMAYVKEALLLTGARAIRGAHPKCLAKGDPACITEFTWQ